MYEGSNEGSAVPELCVVIASDQKEGLPDTLNSYRPHIDALGIPYDLVVVVSGAHADQYEALREIMKTWPQLTVIGQRPWVGEDAALATGLRRGEGDLVLLLPGWPQIEPEDISSLFETMQDRDDMVSAVRSGEGNGAWQGIRKGVFARILRRLFGTVPSDPFCRARLVRRETLEDAAHFGVRQHFLPVIAAQRGHVLAEAPVRPVQEDKSARYVFKPLGHVRALLDALALYVVLKFLRRPLRFFGAIGLPIFLVGAVLTSILVFYRLFGTVALADRPALIFAVMMVVLGIQIIAIGLIGEIIIFAGARVMKQYDVSEVITSGPRAASMDAATSAGVVSDAQVPANDHPQGGPPSEPRSGEPVA